MTVAEAIEHKSVSAVQAIKRGFEPLTDPYDVITERDQLQKVIDDMVANGVRWHLVAVRRDSNGYKISRAGILHREVWRIMPITPGRLTRYHRENIKKALRKKYLENNT